MAVLTSNRYEGRFLQLEVWEEGFDEAANTSTLAWRLSSLGGAAGYYGISPTTVVIDGQTVYQKGMTAWNSREFPAARGSVEGTLTVLHEADGRKTVFFSLSTYVYATPSPLPVWEGSLNLTNLGGGTPTGNAQAALISAAGDGILGESCLLQWTPRSEEHTFCVSFVLREEQGALTEQETYVSPRSTAPFRCLVPLPYALAETIPGETARPLELKLTTLDPGGEPVGSPSRVTITVTVPENAQTRPVVTAAALQPSPDPFAGLYIQSQTGVRMTAVTASGQLGAAIARTFLRVEGRNYEQTQDHTSEALIQFGSVKVSVWAVDSRGFTSEPFETVLTVIPYSKPRLKPAPGQNRPTALRCDKDGLPLENGSFLKLLAKRQYSSVIRDGTAHNFCCLQYRYRRADAEDPWSDWSVFLEENAQSHEIVTGPLPLELAPEGSYLVQLRALDTLGGEARTQITLSPEQIYWHRDGAKGALGFGCLAEETDVFVIGSGKVLKLLGGLALEGDAAETLLNLAHPIGSVLETVSDQPPARELGGTWLAIAGSETTTRWLRTE